MVGHRRPGRSARTALISKPVAETDERRPEKYLDKGTPRTTRVSRRACCRGSPTQNRRVFCGSGRKYICIRARCSTQSTTYPARAPRASAGGMPESYDGRASESSAEFLRRHSPPPGFKTINRIRSRKLSESSRILSVERRLTVRCTLDGANQGALSPVLRLRARKRPPIANGNRGEIRRSRQT